MVEVKKLLYIGRPNLGENMFATPCLDFLSKEYEITLLCPDSTIPAFNKYNFIKRVLPGCNHGDSASVLPPHTQVTLKQLLKEGDWHYAYHHDDDINFLQKYPELLQLKKLPILHDKELKIISNTNNEGYFISRTKKYMLKLQLMSLEKTMTYDCKVRCPTKLPITKSNEIIIYQGSKECLRKLSNETINKFVKAVPHATFLVTHETAELLKLVERGIKFLHITQPTQQSLENIIKLFETGPKVMIGPDSGLTQLACGYRIPLIWLQSRIPIQSVIDIQHKDYYKIYLKKELTCKQECLGCLSLKTTFESTGKFEIKAKRINHKNMDCYIKKQPLCLDYTEKDIQNIIELI